MKAIGIRQIPGKPGQVYYPLEYITLPPPTPKRSELVVKILAAGLNHRDHFIREHLYPGIAFSVPLLTDGVGVVVSAGKPNSQWVGKRVVLAPGRGWEASPHGPETSPYAILGGTKHAPQGTLGEVIVVPESEVEEAPAHLSLDEAAGLPLCGLTAYRAVFTKGNVKAGDNVLITGIGGGVALAALSFCVAVGANVWVTSGSPEKLEAAKKLGARGGVSYKKAGWEKELKAMLPLPAERSWLDVVIDGAGDDVCAKTVPILRAGGKIVSYGMTLAPKTPFTMSAVFKNVEIRGTTLGSRKEFGEMVELVRKHRLGVVVSKVAQGLTIEACEEVFEIMKKGKQFGKLIIRIADEERETVPSKL